MLESDHRPLRIALLTHSVNPRGGVVHCIELAHALQALGHEVTVMAPAQPGEVFFRPLHCAVQYAPLPPGKPASLADLVGARIAAYEAHLARTLPGAEAAGFDILHAHDGIGANALATLQQRGLIAGFVRTVHHLDSFDDPRLIAWQARGYRAAQRVLVVSRLWREIMAREHGIQALQVSNGVDVKRFTPRPDARDAALARRLGLAGAGPIVLAAGGVEERKNTLRLLQAFALLRQHQPDAHLLIAGGASLLDHGRYAGEFQAVLDASGLHAAVHLSGVLPESDMPALFRLADVFAMPSLREGFGLTVLESLASGTPVVASRIAPFTEYLGDTDCTWCDPLDPGSIAAALQSTLAAPRRQPWTLPAVCRQYSWHGSAALHAHIYHDLLHAYALS